MQEPTPMEDAFEIVKWLTLLMVVLFAFAMCGRLIMSMLSVEERVPSPPEIGVTSPK